MVSVNKSVLSRKASKISLFWLGCFLGFGFLFYAKYSKVKQDLGTWVSPKFN